MPHCLFEFASPLLLPLLGLIVGSLNLPFLHQGVVGWLIEAMLK